MILKENFHKLRNVIHGLVDCEWNDVQVHFDREMFMKYVKEEFPEVNFVEEKSDNFEQIDFIRASGKLNLPYDPTYSIRVYLYKSQSTEDYYLEILD